MSTRPIREIPAAREVADLISDFDRPSFGTLRPHSVRIGFVLRDGKIYIDPSEERGWYQRLKANPSVRVRIGGLIYRARAVRVTDPAELEGFEPDRDVQRLELAGGDAG
jgi:hypothetical protein